MYQQFQNPFAPKGIPPELLMMLIKLSQQKPTTMTGVMQQKKASEAVKKILGLGGAGGGGAYLASGASTPAAPVLVSASKIGASAPAATSAMSPGSLAPTFSAPATELPALAPMAAEGGATTAVAAPTAMPYAYSVGLPAALLAVGLGPKWAPGVAAQGKKFAQSIGVGDKNPERSWNTDEAIQSRTLDRQLPGFNKMSESQKKEVADLWHNLPVKGKDGQTFTTPSFILPGSASSEGGPTTKGIGEGFLMPRVSLDTKRKLSDKFGKWWTRTTPIEDVVDYLGQTHSLKSNYLDAYKSAIDKTNQITKQNDFNSMMENYLSGSSNPQQNTSDFATKLKELFK